MFASLDQILYREPEFSLHDKYLDRLFWVKKLFMHL